MKRFFLLSICILFIISMSSCKNIPHYVEKSEILTNDGKMKVAWIYRYENELYDYRYVTDITEINKLNEFKNSDDYHAANNSGEYEGYEGTNAYWVIYEDGTVIGMYSELDYGNLGKSITWFGNDYYLPDGFTEYVKSLCE